MLFKPQQSEPASAANKTGRPGLLLLLVPAVLVAGFAASQAGTMAAELVVGRELLFAIGFTAGLFFAFAGMAAYHGLVFICFALLGLVQIEPAPVDALAMFLLASGIISGQLSLRSLRESSAWHAAIWLFLLVNLIALPGATDHTYAIRYTVISLYLIGLAYFIKLYVHSERAMRYVMFGYLCSSLLSVFLVFLGYAGIGPPDTFVFESRARAFFKDANVYAPSLVLAVVFLVDEIFKPYLMRGWTWLKLICIFLLAAGVFLSFSRASTANMLLAVAIYFLFNWREVLQPRRLLAIIGCGVLAVVGLAIVIVQLDLLEFLLWRAAPVQSYDVSNRFATQAFGIEAGLTHLFGIGPGMLADGHSLYIRTFAEYGIFGFLALMSGLAILVSTLGRAAMQEVRKPYGLSARVVFASLISNMLNGFVIDLIHWRQFWFLIGLAWVVALARHQNESETWRFANAGRGF